MAELSLEKWLCGTEGIFPGGTRLIGLDDLAKAMVLSELHRRTGRPLLAIFSAPAQARNAIDNFECFSGKQHSGRVHYLPPIEFNFHRGLVLNPEIIFERNVALFHAMNEPENRVFITTVRALLQKAVPPQIFLEAVKVLKAEQDLDRDELIASLSEMGYQRQPSAYDPGIFTVRGGVVDIYCPLYSQPVRLEFFGDFIEEIRFFDPKSQRSLEKIDKFFIIPVGQTLLPHGNDFLEASLKLKDRLDHLGVAKSRREEILEKIQNRQNFNEISLLFPLLSKGASSPYDYFPVETFRVWDGREGILEKALGTELPDLERNFSLFEAVPVPIAERDHLFMKPSEVEGMVRPSEDLFFEDFDSPGVEHRFLLQRSDISLSRERESLQHKKSNHPLLKSFSDRILEWLGEGNSVHIICHTVNHAERIAGLFEPYGVHYLTHPEKEAGFPCMLQGDFEKLNLWIGFINRSQFYPGLRLVILSEEEIFGRKKRVSKVSSWVASPDSNRLLSSFRDLKINDLVVHKEHGIGRYLGLKSMTFQGITNDFVLMEYRDGDKLYVPVYRLNVLQKYSAGEGETATVDKLGGDRWIKAKKKAQRAVAELAQELLQIQARRKLVEAFAFSPAGEDYQEFEMEFPFDETPDQLRSIDEVMHDLSQPTPMDRLICGDVGYGKTEVAMRAAYRCVMDDKQVAVLVPTTVLAFQHYESFKKRLLSTAVRVEMVSRLRSVRQVKKVLEDLKEGKVDILIGTHRLLSSDVKFKDLGLVVVDEEHRFGVVHKEKLKKMTQSVHYLSMTATPIPRTLNMAMNGIKDVSVIVTPPPDRLSVRTFVCRRTQELIIEAISNEMARDGQVFFVNNRIEVLPKITQELEGLFPKVKMEVVHGQMEPGLLEKKMLAFYQGEVRVLITTAIIESGLDVPRANTIIIDRADQFGLAQLYQLRGRVGRAEKRAYCYILVQNENQITEQAKERLQVIQRYSDLGSGFFIASHDLEIRGAGDLLGKSQSGHITAVGVDYYFELLENHIRELSGEKAKTEIEPEITLKVAAFLPDNYLPDVGERIAVYRRLSGVEDEEDISRIEEEIRDRFGKLPEEVNNLLGLMTIKLYLKRLHVIRMGCGPKRTSLQFAPTTPASSEILVRLIQQGPTRYSMTPDQKLVFNVDDTSWMAQLREVKALAEKLGV